MSELLREIEEDIRRERMDKLWAKFGRMAISGSIAVVLGTAAAVLWQQHKESESAKYTGHLLQGADRMSVEDYKGAVKAFDELAAEKPRFYALAMLRKAEAQEASGDTEGAKKTYEQLAVHGEEFAGLGQLLAGGDVTPGKKSPFYHSESEWAAWRLSEQGKKEEAKAIFTSLANDDTAPASLKSRAALALTQMDSK